ncbi:tripartite tricarboxylate transporter TctB family protein [Polaromonas sp.]|uniref:tripartite tricarboxylate transporter TctB family protein n=1 Tax=Polaromonas sp. TaxID=1869339 RepID=UPI0027316854|nr:tripartite tricarboxylate transporter TctB family protein [Polaromonas sp.]MDP1740845.1 tripartite tricarboxylate transporter TctB family protein [Polaromonas sp.]
MTEGVNTARSDLWGGAGWVGFGLLIVVESLRMDRFKAMGAELYTMPGFVPGMIGGVLMLLGAILMLRGWRRGSVPHTEVEPAGLLLNRRVIATLLLTLVYATGLIGRLPFWLATALFVAAFVGYFAPPEKTPARRLMAAVLAGALTALIVTLVFQYVFLVRLP